MSPPAIVLAGCDLRIDETPMFSAGIGNTDMAVWSCFQLYPISLPALHRTRQQTAHEKALQGKEYGDWHNDGYKCAGGENFPVLAA